jgi:hypothetical protein
MLACRLRNQDELQISDSESEVQIELLEDPSIAAELKHCCSASVMSPVTTRQKHMQSPHT